VNEKARSAIEGGSRRTLILIGAVLVAVWVVPMSRSLWLDETITWWVVQGGIGQAIHRAISYQQSPLYYLLAWPFARAGGHSEFVLRVPSVLSAVAAAILLWRLARRVIGKQAAPFAVLAFAGTWASVEAHDARPYALALAFAIGAALALVELLDRPRARSACLYGLLVAAMVWAHYLSAVVLVAHGVYVVIRRRKGTTSIGWGPALVAVGLGLILVLPLAGQIASLWARRFALGTGGSAGFFGMFLLISNPVVVPAVAIAAAVCRARPSFVRFPLRDSGGALILGLTFLPPLTLFAASWATAPQFLNGRYLVSATPGTALLVAWGLMTLRPEAVRRATMWTLAILTAVAFSIWADHTDDWRSAVGAVAANADEETLVLARVGLVEAKQVDWLTDPERSAYLLAPFSFYPVAADPVALPLYPHDPGADAYLTGLLHGPIHERDRFVLIERYDTYRLWFEERLVPLGWSSRVIGSYGGPEVSEFTR